MEKGKISYMQKNKDRIIVCYGDSNTYGYDPCVPGGGRYSKENRWPALIEEKTGIPVKNYGLCGRKIPVYEGQFQCVREQIEAWSREAETISLWIMLGTNDFLENEKNTAEDVALRMEKFLESIKEKAEEYNVSILLISPVPVKQGSWVENPRICRETQRLSGFYKEIAGKFGADFADAGEWEIPLAFDGVHFTEKGHRVFASRCCFYINNMENDYEKSIQ